MGCVHARKDFKVILSWWLTVYPRPRLSSPIHQAYSDIFMSKFSRWLLMIKPVFLAYKCESLLTTSRTLIEPQRWGYHRLGPHWPRMDTRMRLAFPSPRLVQCASQFPRRVKENDSTDQWNLTISYPCLSSFINIPFYAERHTLLIHITFPRTSGWH